MEKEQGGKSGGERIQGVRENALYVRDKERRG
jgi:hypothetical protein